MKYFGDIKVGDKNWILGDNGIEELVIGKEVSIREFEDGTIPSDRSWLVIDPGMCNDIVISDPGHKLIYEMLS